MVLLHSPVLPPQLTVLIPCVGYRSRWAWSGVRSREFGEVCLIVEFFLHRAHSLLLSVLGRRSADEGRSQRRQPAGRAVGRGGPGRGGTGRDGTGQAAGVEALDGTSGGAGCPFPLLLYCSRKIIRYVLSYFVVLSAVFFSSSYSSLFSAGVKGRDGRNEGWAGRNGAIRAVGRTG